MPTFCVSYKPKSPDKVLGDTVLTDGELQEFATGYVDYPKDAYGDYDWNHPKITKGAIQPVMRQIAIKADTYTRSEIAKVLKAWYPYCQTLQGQLEFDRFIKELEGK